VAPIGSGAQPTEVPVATFVVLARFSDQGIKNVKQTIEHPEPSGIWQARRAQPSRASFGRWERTMSLHGRLGSACPKKIR
jgi:hypothetical protein